MTPLQSESAHPEIFSFGTKFGFDRHHHLHAEWTSTVDDIRKLPGLESFLLPPHFQRLQVAAEKGPVILVNVNALRSDAIIITASGDPMVVPLPQASPDVADALASRLGERPAECHPDDFILVLREIWRIIVEPVVNRLRESPIELPTRSRIWWCPTGVASRLPLHAAGPYVRGERNLINWFISSYTPTLGALIRARGARLETAPHPKTILVVGQADTPNERPLPKVANEVQAIQDRAPNALILESSSGTREAVLRGLGEHPWVHLACHGHHHPTQPFHSHFSMYDGPITSTLR